jgi:hypothetical protein
VVVFEDSVACTGSGVKLCGASCRVPRPCGRFAFMSQKKSTAASSSRPKVKRLLLLPRDGLLKGLLLM